MKIFAAILLTMVTGLLALIGIAILAALLSG